MEKKLSREEAWGLLTEFTKTPALQKHALAVEAVMVHLLIYLTRTKKYGALPDFSMIWIMKNIQTNIAKKLKKSCEKETSMRPIFVL